MNTNVLSQIFTIDKLGPKDSANVKETQKMKLWLLMTLIQGYLNCNSEKSKYGIESQIKLV